MCEPSVSKYIVALVIFYPFSYSSSVSNQYYANEDYVEKKYGIFHTLMGWVGLKKSFSIKIKNKKHGLKMPKYSFKNNLFFSIWGGQHTTPSDPGLRLKDFCGEWGVVRVWLY